MNNQNAPERPTARPDVGCSAVLGIHRIQIETITLLDGSKMDVIRDIDKVRHIVNEKEDIIRVLTTDDHKATTPLGQAYERLWKMLNERERTAMMPNNNITHP